MSPRAARKGALARPVKTVFSRSIPACVRCALEEATLGAAGQGPMPRVSPQRFQGGFRCAPRDASHRIRGIMRAPARRAGLGRDERAPGAREGGLASPEPGAQRPCPGGAAGRWACFKVPAIEHRAAGSAPRRSGPSARCGRATTAGNGKWIGTRQIICLQSWAGASKRSALRADTAQRKPTPVAGAPRVRAHFQRDSYFFMTARPANAAAGLSRVARLRNGREALRPWFSRRKLRHNKAVS